MNIVCKVGIHYLATEIKVALYELKFFRTWSGIRVGGGILSMFYATDFPFAYLSVFLLSGFYSLLLLLLLLFSFSFLIVFLLYFTLSICILFIFILCLRVTLVFYNMQTYGVNFSHTRSHQLQKLILFFLESGDSLAALSFMGMSCRRPSLPRPWP